MRLIRHEARRLVRSPSTMWLVLILGLCCAIAAMQGQSRRVALDNAHAAALAADIERESKFRARLAASPSPEDAALLPTQVEFALVKPVPRLADFSFGVADMAAESTSVRLRTRIDTLFAGQEVQNPEHLVRGALNLGFIAAIVAPLALIALGFGVAATDRDSGRSRVILVQAGDAARLMLARSVLSIALTATPIVAVAAWLLLTGPPTAERFGAGALWLFAAIAGLVFWQGLILLVNALRISAETAATALFALWALFAFAAPAAITGVAQAIHTPPSVMSYIGLARQTEIAASRAYENDHPDLTFATAEGLRGIVRMNTSIGDSIYTAVAPAFAHFEAQRAANDALVERVSLISPPLAVYRSLADVAGGSAAHEARFRDAARGYVSTFRNAIRPIVMSDASMTIDDFDALPRFTAPDAPLQTPWAALVMFAVGLLGAGIAIRRMRRSFA